MGCWGLLGWWHDTNVMKWISPSNSLRFRRTSKKNPLHQTNDSRIGPTFLPFFGAWTGLHGQPMVFFGRTRIWEMFSGGNIPWAKPSEISIPAILTWTKGAKRGFDIWHICIDMNIYIYCIYIYICIYIICILLHMYVYIHDNLPGKSAFLSNVRFNSVNKP